MTRSVAMVLFTQPTDIFGYESENGRFRGSYKRRTADSMVVTDVVIRPPAKMASFKYNGLRYYVYLGDVMIFVRDEF